MLGKVQQLALVVHDPTDVEILNRAHARMMDDPRMRRIDARPAGRANSATEVRLLEIHVETFIESPEGSNRRRSHEQASAHHVLNLALGIMAPGQHVGAGQNLAARKQPVETSEIENRATQRGEMNAGRLERRIRIDQLRTHDRNTLISIGNRDHGSHRGWENLRIGVQQQDIAPPGTAQAPVAGLRKPHVVAIGNQFDARVGISEEVRAAVFRVVVDHDDLQTQIVWHGEEACDTGAQQRPTVPVNDYHCEIRRFCGQADSHGYFTVGRESHAQPAQREAWRWPRLPRRSDPQSA